MHLSLFRMVDGFISTGLTDTQYISSCKAANIGNVEEKYICTGNLVTCWVLYFYIKWHSHCLGQICFQLHVYLLLLVETKFNKHTKKKGHTSMHICMFTSTETLILFTKSKGSSALFFWGYTARAPEIISFVVYIARLSFNFSNKANALMERADT